MGKGENGKSLNWRKWEIQLIQKKWEILMIQKSKLR